MAELVWTAGAAADLQKIFNLLEGRRAGAGIEFLANVEARLELTKKFPRMNRTYFPPFRMQRLIGSRGLFYVIENRGIIVHAIADLRQNPEALRRRILGED